MRTINLQKKKKKKSLFGLSLPVPQILTQIKHTTDQKQHQLVQTPTVISQNYQEIRSFREFKDKAASDGQMLNK